MPSTSEIDKLIKRESELAGYSGEFAVVPAASLRDELTQTQRNALILRSGLPTLDNLIDGFELGELTVITGPTKGGKCHGRGTGVLLFDGSIKAVEDIRIGDLLMGDDSTPRRVLSVASGRGDIYRVTPKRGSDGEFTVNADHILCLQRTGTTSRHSDNLKGKIYEIALRDYFQLSKTQKHILKSYRVPISFAFHPLPIEPYFLGLWLGDGTSSNQGITTADKEVVLWLKDFCDRNGYYLTQKKQKDNKSSVYRVCQSQKGRVGIRPRNDLLHTMRRLEIIPNKHIPLIYRANSTYSRLELLAGLVDSDGYVEKRGAFGHTNLGFIFKNKQLAKDVIYLCRSLGFSASIRASKKRSQNGTAGDYWRISVNGKLEQIPSRLERKRFIGRPFTKDILRSAFTVNTTKEREFFGFEIDGNGRYVLADFTVTHNTLLAQTFTETFVKRGNDVLWIPYEVSGLRFIRGFGEELPDFKMPRKLKVNALDWLHDRIDEAKIKYGVRAVFIDHLHFLCDLAKMRSPSLEIGAIMRRIVGMTHECHVAMFLIAHMTKIAPDKEPERGDTRDSSFIEQECDNTLAVWRSKEKGSCRARIKVIHNRRKGVFDETFQVEKVGPYLRELSNQEEPEEQKKGGHWWNREQ